MVVNVLDPNQVKILQSLDSHGEVFARLIRVFESEVLLQLDELETQFKQKNFMACRYLIHSIKSSALNIGAQRLAQLAERLEDQLSSPIVNISYEGILELRDVFIYSSARLKGESSLGTE